MKDLVTKIDKFYQSELQKSQNTSKILSAELNSKTLELASLRKEFDLKLKSKQEEITKLSEQHKADVKKVEERLRGKYAEVVEKMNKYFIDSECSNFSQISDERRGDDREDTKKNEVPANNTKGHPLVPKLDLTEVVPDIYDSSHGQTPDHGME
mmetsp:Transcript_32544/g.31927  ORF Transcript_32544/g.31927 Transcript_32544/m.31927 type:complete len:154 (-) Transcript_32544:118-579(-)